MELAEALEGVFHKDVRRAGLAFVLHSQLMAHRYDKFAFYYPVPSVSTPFFVQHDLAHCLAMCFLNREHRLFYPDFRYNEPGAVSPAYNLNEEFVALSFQEKFTRSFGAFGTPAELRNVVTTAIANKVCQAGGIHHPATCIAIHDEMRKRADEQARVVTDESVHFMAMKLWRMALIQRAKENNKVYIAPLLQDS